VQVHRTYVCKVCGQKFEDVASLNEHKRQHARDKDYACSECGMKFQKPYILRRHMLIHTGERPFTCEVCMKLCLGVPNENVTSVAPVQMSHKHVLKK